MPIYVLGPIDVATAKSKHGCNTCPKFCACMALVNFPVVIFYSHRDFLFQNDFSQGLYIKHCKTVSEFFF